jgi:monoamine oxidase
VTGASGGLRLLSSFPLSRYLNGGSMIPPHSKNASHSNRSFTHSMNPTINPPRDGTTNLHPASSTLQIHNPENAAPGRNRAQTPPIRQTHTHTSR